MSHITNSTEGFKRIFWLNKIGLRETSTILFKSLCLKENRLSEHLKHWI